MPGYFNGSLITDAYYNGYRTSGFYNGEMVWGQQESYPKVTVLYDGANIQRFSPAEGERPLSDYDSLIIYSCEKYYNDPEAVVAHEIDVQSVLERGGSYEVVLCPIEYNGQYVYDSGCYETIDLDNNVIQIQNANYIRYSTSTNVNTTAHADTDRYFTRVIGIDYE